jgi:hypothetical protein
MRRLVVPSRLSGVPIALALVFVVSGCSSTTTASSSTKSSAANSAASGNHATAALPGLGSGCDQSTTGDNTPDNSATAFLAGGGSSIQAMVAKMDNEQKDGVDVYTKYLGSGGAILPIIPPSKLGPDGLFKPAYLSPINRVVKGVICPNGDIYVAGNPTKWMTGAWLMNRNPSGTVENQSSSVLFGHPAAQVLKAPCAALLQDTRTPQLAPNPAYKRGVCLSGTAVFLFNHLYS